MNGLTQVDSCLNRVMDIMNPRDLLVHVGLPAVTGIIASRLIGTYQPDPNIPARRFSPITVAVYTGLSSAITRLALDALCRMSHRISARDIFDVFGGGTVFLALGAGIGVVAAKHILARDTAHYFGGEEIDIGNGSLFNLAATLLQ